MKTIRNLFIALFTFVTICSFAVPSHSVIFGTTTNVTCSIGDTLKFYGTNAGGYTVSINNVNITMGSILVNGLIGSKHIVTGSEATFKITNGSTSSVFPGTITVNTTTGITESTNTTTIKVFPNPVVDILKVSTNIKTKINIFNISGQSVLSKDIEIGTTDIDMTEFSSGIYFVNIENKTQKVTKQ